MEVKNFLKEVQIDEKLGFFKTFKEIVCSPAKFFDNLKGIEGYTLPTIKFIFFYFIFASVLGFPFFILQLIAKLGVNIILLVLSTLAYFIGVIIIGFIIIFIQVGITHIFFKLFRGRGNLTTTLQVIGYGLAPSVIGAIPILGFIGMIYSLVVMTKGGKRLHEINAFLSFLSIILPFVIFMVIGVIIMVLVSGFVRML